MDVKCLFFLLCDSKNESFRQKLPSLSTKKKNVAFSRILPGRKTRFLSFMKQRPHPFRI